MLLRTSTAGPLRIDAAAVVEVVHRLGAVLGQVDRGAADGEQAAEQAADQRSRRRRGASPP